jgi:hypothetical protein
MVGSFVIFGGISKKDCQAVVSLGNLTGMFLSAYSITCGEITGVICFAKQAARITPAAPVGEFSPAKIALVSRKALNFFGILFLPNLVSGIL